MPVVLRIASPDAGERVFECIADLADVERAACRGLHCDVLHVDRSFRQADFFLKVRPLSCCTSFGPIRAVTALS